MALVLVVTAKFCAGVLEQDVTTDRPRLVQPVKVRTAVKPPAMVPPGPFTYTGGLGAPFR